MATDPRGDEDPLSPTTIILNYLRSQGLKPNAENIRAAVMANARNPDQAGADPVGYVSDTGREISLRNAAPEDSAPAASGGGRGGGTRRTGVSSAPVDRHDDPNTSAQPGPMQPPPVPPRIIDPAAGPSTGEMINRGLPPPTDPARVGVTAIPEVPPPTPGAAAAVPEIPPPTSLEIPMQRAIGGPPSLPALPAPPEVPQLPAPPEVPRVAGPQPQLALPAPPEAPTPALPAPRPRITVESLTGSAPGAAPGKPVQGYPIESSPITRAIPRVGAGAAAGAARGGVPGAVVGGGAAAIQELAPYILKNLHLW